MIINGIKSIYNTRLIYAFGWFIAALLPLTDGDIWWHLASGRDMVQNASVQVADFMTFTAQGKDWINVHWLYQLLIYGFYQVGGDWALVVSHALMWGFAAYLWAIKTNSKYWLLLLLPLVFVSHYLLLARPIVWTLVLLGLQKNLQESGLSIKKQLLGIIILQILLANSQGLFVLGIILWTIRGLLLKYSIKNLLGGHIVLWLASALNPHLFELWLYPFRLLNRLNPNTIFGQRISENISPLKAFFFNELPWGSTALLYEAIALIVFTVIVGYWIKSDKEYKVGILFVLPILVLAYTSERNLVIMYVILVPLVGEFLERKWPFRLGYSLGVTMIVASTVAFAQWWFISPSPIAPYRFPTQAMQWFLQNKPNKEYPVRCFNEIRHGGYISWVSHANLKTYVDGRLILRNADFFREYLLAQESEAIFENILVRERINTVILPFQNPPHFRSAMSWLNKNSQWKQIYSDENTGIWILKDH